MPLDPEEELRSLWLKWLKDAKSVHQSEGPKKFDRFYVDERNQPEDSGTDGRNSVMDAEALLCFLQPQGSLDSFSIRSGFKSHSLVVDDINRTILPSTESGSPLEEDAINIIVDLTTDYLESNRREYLDGNRRVKRPVFGAQSYLDPVAGSSPKVNDNGLDIVDSFTMSLSACLHILYLMGRSGWGNSTNARLEEKCAAACVLASERLTHAMEGLCRSFAYKETSKSTWEKNTLILWPAKDPDVEEIRKRIQRLAIRTNDNQAFECGWSWGPHPEARGGLDSKTTQPNDAIASTYPYLYFTLNAMDGIEDLFEEWVQTEEILSPEQLALAARLRNLSNLTGRYWAAVAFGTSKAQPGRWALEAIPWRTADGIASPQWSLYVYGLALREHLAQRRVTTPSESVRLIAVLEELAERGRLTCQPVDNLLPRDVLNKLKQPDQEGNEPDPWLLMKAKRDPALSLHWPGLELTLEDHQDLPIYTLSIYDFAPQLLKRAAILLRNTSDLDLRERLRALIDTVWDEHLSCRSNVDYVDQQGVPKYWDFPEKAYSEIAKYDAAALSIERPKDTAPQRSERVASWYITQRVAEAMVALSLAIEKRQRVRLTTVEVYVRELSDHLANDIDLLIARSGSSAHEGLQELRTKANAVRSELDKGRLTSCLRLLHDLIDQIKEP